MNKFSITIFILLLITVINSSSAQTVDYGIWRDHLPYNNIKTIVEVGDKIYAATPYSLFYYDKNYENLVRINKTTSIALSDIGISDIAYSLSMNTLIIAYSNTNIDLLKNGNIINIPDIKRKSIIGNKTINHIFIKDKYAYLACGFGIVVVDLEKEEIKDTYYIGTNGSQINVTSITYLQESNEFYAATEVGIYKASTNSNLAYFINWQKLQDLPKPNGTYNLITTLAGKLCTNLSQQEWGTDTMYIKYSDGWRVLHPGNHEPKLSMKICGDRLLVCGTYNVNIFRLDGSWEIGFNTYSPTQAGMLPNDAIIDKDKNIWVADTKTGLRKLNTNADANIYMFSGPSSASTVAMDYCGNQLWAAMGGRDGSYGNLWRHAEFYTYKDHKWTSYTNKEIPEITSWHDIVCVAADPSNPNHAFAGSWGKGIVEVENGVLKNIYNTSNSSLQYMTNTSNIRIGGLAFDKNNNLWVTNSGAPNTLSIRKSDGAWRSYNLGSLGTGVETGKLYIDHLNQKWIELRDNAWLVFNDNNTPDNITDDKIIKLTNSAGNGNLPGTRSNCLAVDREGQVWIGSNEGVSVIYSPTNIFSGSGFDAQRVMIENNGFLYPLLETESINTIAINGNNEKWIGTDKAGAFLMSADGTKQILHFTETNSPLFSNSIQDIKIAPNGEVFFATSLGTVSYQDYKVAPSASLDSLTIYPNPVRPGYSGPIFINNMVEHSNVKITDVTGNIVWETENQGGQILWYGVDFKNRKVNSGAYYIYITNSEQTQQKIGKVLIIR